MIVSSAFELVDVQLWLSYPIRCENKVFKVVEFGGVYLLGND